MSGLGEVKNNQMKIDNSTYYISEIFESIQGEGNYAGVNALFIRFHFCNLSCNWCDTKYTWLEKSGKFKLYSAVELKALITASKPYHIVFTGGEPAIYRLDQLIVDNKKFHVETNGTMLPNESIKLLLKDSTGVNRDPMNFEIIKKFNWVVSPKLGNSYQQIEEEKFNYWVDKDFVVFKFIVRSVIDIEEVELFISKLKIDKRVVYLGLEGTSLHSQLQPELVDEIRKRGFNFSPRLHVMLWGNERGR
jgi:7-carboxy-7-deazaguanine synthase